jgi:hypothetical protein
VWFKAIHPRRADQYGQEPPSWRALFASVRAALALPAQAYVHAAAQ